MSENQYKLNLDKRELPDDWTVHRDMLEDGDWKDTYKGPSLYQVRTFYTGDVFILIAWRSDSHTQKTIDTLEDGGEAAIKAVQLVEYIDWGDDSDIKFEDLNRI